MSRYSGTWDVSLVLSYLKSISVDFDVSLKMLTLKLVLLIALVLAGRSQSLHLLTIEGMRKESSKYILRYVAPLKQSKAGRSLPVVELKEFTPDRRICVYTILTSYLEKTKSLRGNNMRLFISFFQTISFSDMFHN